MAVNAINPSDYFFGVKRNHLSEAGGIPESGWVTTGDQWVTVEPIGRRGAEAKNHVTFYAGPSGSVRIPITPDLPSQGDWQVLPGTNLVRFVFSDTGSFKVTKMQGTSKSGLVAANALRKQFGRDISGRYPFRFDGPVLYIDLTARAK